MLGRLSRWLGVDRRSLPWRYLAEAALVAALVWTAAWFGLNRHFDERAYDTFSMLKIRFSEHRPSVVLLEIGGEAGMSAVDWGSTWEELSRLGARAWAVSLGASIDQRTRQAFAGDGSVGELPLALGLRPVRDPIEPSRLLAPAGAAELSDELLAWSALSGPVGRCQPTDLAIDGRALPTFAWAVAGRLGVGVAPAATRTSGLQSSAGCFLINFGAGLGSLPMVTLERLTSGTVSSSLFEGRVVVVGEAERDALGGVLTPAGGHGATMSLMEYQGHAVDTLLAQRSPGTLSDTWFAVLLGLVALSVQWLRTRGALRWLVWWCLGLGALFVAVNVVTFWFFNIFTPLAAPLATIALLLGGATRSQLLVADQSARQLLRGSVTRMRSRLYPGSFYLVDDPWTQISELVSHLFELERMIFLENVPGDHRVREVHAVGCGIDDIGERRRDYLRSPYRDAIRRNGPLRLDSSYLKGHRAGEIQYLVPLRFGHEVLGFWALGVPARVADAIDFDSLLFRFADQVGELLYHRQRMQKAAVDGPSTGVRQQGQEDTYRTLQWVSMMLERRLARMESLLHGLGTMVVVYDLFGRVLTTTSYMRSRLAGQDLHVHNLSALELLIELLKVDKDVARAHLRASVVEGRVVNFRMPMAADRREMLRLAPIRLADESAGADDGGPIGIVGVALELEDLSASTAVVEMKDRLCRDLGDRLRGELAAVELGLDQIGRGQLPAEDTERLTRLVSQRVDLLRRLVDESLPYLRAPFDELFDQPFPLALDAHLSRIIEDVRVEAGLRKVELHSYLDASTSKVLASPVALAEGVKSILALLLDDAQEGDSIRVSVDETRGETRIHFDGLGYGQPTDRLEEIIEGHWSSSHAWEKQLADFAGQVDRWGGSLQVAGQLGVGTEIDLRLCRLQTL